nr:hypothetical protein [Methyloprofundus sedimenti]
MSSGNNGKQQYFTTIIDNDRQLKPVKTNPLMWLAKPHFLRRFF